MIDIKLDKFNTIKNIANPTNMSDKILPAESTTISAINPKNIFPNYTKQYRKNSMT